MSKAKWLLWAAPVAGAVGLGVCVDQWLSAAGEAKQDLKPAVTLPISRVVLFNSGVGYFSRSGEVEGDARVDLTFPEGDVNDLLKSMVLEDFSTTGRVSAVSYDSREPIARTLSSFAINLTGSPTLAGILGQLRGERVEVAVSATAANQPGKLSGTIVGIEKQRVPAGTQVLDAEVLNLWCAEGLRAVKLGDVQTLRFSNPVIESEFRRALDVLALSHDSQKKAVSLHFAGDGRRRVQVGYVTEAPIWKTSYRLLLDAGNKEKPYLQGWAMVENPTDEDWAGVKMALVSGRPISFKMDLYNPLYVNRPTVEPELFASLRPVTYSGGFKDSNGLAYNGPADAKAAKPMIAAAPAAPPGSGGFGGGGFGGPGGGPESRMRLADTDEKRDAADRKRYANDFGRELASKMNQGVVGNAATSGALGDFFQYTIDHPVTLPRQKSALLPIVGKEVEGARVSIYNPAVQAKHPLLGLRFKNTSGAHLNQGPVTVFEGSVYAGDTRVLDVQPNEERLVSYAIDLGTEVDPTAGAGKQQITRVKAVKGIVHTVTQVTEEKTYRIANRSATDRTVLIEHPNRTAQQVKLVDTPKPVDDTPEVLRFQAPVAAGRTTTFTVKEQRDVATTIALSNGAEDQIRYFLSLNEATPALKKKLAEALQIKDGWDGAARELRQVQEELRRLTADQDRIRKNLRETPREAEVYATYLKKLSDQEKEIDALTAKEKQHTAAEFAARKKYEDYLANISD
ncbi:hypothetical protein GobsT_24380 [Gemmata obscuriglobus]|uniref:DUF4139 domain-containing protein n=1 Tax=Gemmata obscuriglobus TaxID=114 RepID=A0A2Z3HC70_9BACT|nr:DUF4139 domain-containing protein [Gemmata obscuriglobus]AWM39264.1 DUF4139 domain-containing protein [Gemmata obscuriglobus]QEG27679.1 hypothetical protein GobsT_24380 [Gemmata obscuriglobus]VTS04881.1 Uncharacterized protein OS=Pirellula staleyi (strain ATCC 27377 / DSM 6068 / ICPB 4128) GN=Psta_3290 PE=4 SV=1: DUF4139 [Gemmata obscuriglobus UQM 2246]